MQQWLFIIMVLTGLSAPAFADSNNDSNYNRITINAEATAEIENDLLVAELYVQHQATTSAAAAMHVNEAIEWALEIAKKVEGIKVRTLEYQTHPVYDKSRITAWRANQSIRLETADPERLGDLIGALQERLAMRHLGYQVSTTARKTASNRLIEEAIEAFRLRANRVATSFGFQHYRIVTANIHTGGFIPPQPVYRGQVMAMEARIQSASIEAGTSDINVSVSGTIELY